MKTLNYVREKNPEENWRIVEDYSEYVVSDAGNVFSLKRDQFLKPSKNRSGYLMVRLYDWKTGQKDWSVHRLVALSFIPNYKGKRIVNHIDGIKTNNKISNLEWNTDEESMRHAFDNGLIEGRSGANNPMSKAVIRINPETSEIMDEFESASMAAEHFHYQSSGILMVCRKEMHRYKRCFWMFKEDYLKEGIPNPLPKLIHLTKKVMQLSISGDVITTYDSVKEASDTLGIQTSGISASANKKRNSAGGYVWRFIEY